MSCIVFDLEFLLEFVFENEQEVYVCLYFSELGFDLLLFIMVSVVYFIEEVQVWIFLSGVIVQEVIVQEVICGEFLFWDYVYSVFGSRFCFNSDEEFYQLVDLFFQISDGKELNWVFFMCVLLIVFCSWVVGFGCCLV